MKENPHQEYAEAGDKCNSMIRTMEEDQAQQDMRCGNRIPSRQHERVRMRRSIWIRLQYFHTLARSPFACSSAIDFRIHYLRNFIFGFPVNYDWNRGQLYSLRESVGYSGFKHGHMEDWMDRAYGLWKTESEQQSAKLRDNFVRSEIFFGEFL